MDSVANGKDKMLMKIYRLQLCVILEPMQELMSRHKAYALSPRDCLKTTLFQKWQKMIAPPGKRGRRTVALHENHQPVEPVSELVSMRKSKTKKRKRIKVEIEDESHSETVDVKPKFTLE